MATYFGSAVAGATNLVYGGQPPQSVSSIAHARQRVTLSTLDATPTTSDTIVVGLFKSTDRITDLTIASDGGPTTNGALNIGLHSVDLSNNGLSLTVVDADLFASAQSVVSAIAYGNKQSVFAEAATLDDIMDRGKTLWELAAIGAATYTEDPGLLFAITATPSTTCDAAVELAFTVNYVAGD